MNGAAIGDLEETLDSQRERMHLLLLIQRQ